MCYVLQTATLQELQIARVLNKIKSKQLINNLFTCNETMQMEFLKFLNREVFTQTTPGYCIYTCRLCIK